MSSKPHFPPGSNQHEAPEGSGKDDVGDEDDTKLPPHLRSVRDGLLDFNHFVGLQAALRIAEEKEDDFIPLSAYKPDGVGKLERAREFEFVESTQHLVAYARSIDAQDGYEWHKLFRAVLIDRIDDISCGAHKSIACSLDNEIWREAATINLPKPPAMSSASGLHFGFSVQNTDRRAATGFRKDTSFDNYTRENLAQLTKQGLHCVLPVPSSVDEAVLCTSSKEPEPQSICFPWEIFEACGIFRSPKVEDVSLPDAVSHVSAAASTALSMLETLAKYADEKNDGQHIPPVISIISMGANITVWLAYCNIVDDKTRDHKMITIWEGTITKIWGAIQFCRILDNLFFWAQHCLKPKITQYLSQWRLRFCPDVPKINSLLETDTMTAQLIHQIQDRLSSFGLSPNEDLAALVRQVVISQEVMRWSNKELEEDSTPKEKIKHSTATKSLLSCPRASTLEVSLSSATGSQQTTDRKVCPKKKEDLLQDSEIMIQKGIADPSKPPNVHAFQRNSALKYQKPTLALSNTGKATAAKKSIILQATSSNDMSNKVALNSTPSIISDNGGSRSDKASTSEQMKTSDVGRETRQLLSRPSMEVGNAYLNLVQRTFRSMASRVENGHVIPLKKQRIQDSDLLPEGKRPLSMENTSKLLLRKISSRGNSSGRLSDPPNPFVSKVFELSFELTPWLDLEMTRPTFPIRHRHGPYPTLRIGIVEHTEYPRRTGLRRANLARQPTIISEPPPQPPPPASPLQVKIPWKGKHIMVKLPPTNPLSLSTMRKDDFL